MAYHQDQDIIREEEVKHNSKGVLLVFYFCYNNEEKVCFKTCVISYLQICNPSCVIPPGLSPAPSLHAGPKACNEILSG